MAEYTHVVRLTKEEVEQAILTIALAKKPSGFTVDGHTFHTTAKVAVLVTGVKADVTGAEISWKDE